MKIESSAPSSYKPLPPTASEATDKYRWHVGQTRKKASPPRGKISVDGPLQSPPPKPRLRYHRQSSYTDEFSKKKPFSTDYHIGESKWMNAIGKYGKYYGSSSYERDFPWPEMGAKPERLPLISTIGMGILPILGTKGDQRDEATRKEEASAATAKMEEESDEKAKHQLLQKRSITKDDEMLQDLWPAENTHRIDYLIPPKDFKSVISKPHVPVLKFTGAMETTTTAMMDYQDPRLLEYSAGDCSCLGR